MYLSPWTDKNDRKKETEVKKWKNGTDRNENDSKKGKKTILRN